MKISKCVFNHANKFKHYKWYVSYILVSGKKFISYIECKECGKRFSPLK